MDANLLPPEDYAKQIIEKFEPLVFYDGDDCFTEREKMLMNAKKCALIHIEFVRESWKMPIILTNKIKTSDWKTHINRLNKYYEEVEQKILEA